MFIIIMKVLLLLLNTVNILHTYALALLLLEVMLTGITSYKITGTVGC